MADNSSKPQDQQKQEGRSEDATKLGSLTSMLTGHSTRTPETTEPGDKTTGPGDMGNLLKNQREEG